MLSKIYTAQYRYPGGDRVDITAKGKHPLWSAFAPTWDMVQGVKNGTMTEPEYIKRYDTILTRVPMHVWDVLLQMEEATFVCFCPETAFCHRHLLVWYMTKSLGDRICYMGSRQVPEG